MAVSSAYAGTVISTSAVSSLTVSVAIGTASNDRFILLAIFSNTTGTGKPSAVTVAGVNCTCLGNTLDSANQCSVSFWISDKPVETGTTASVVMTLGTTNNTTRVNAYAVTGMYGSGVPSFKGACNGAGGTTVSGVPFTIPAGGTFVVTDARNSSSVTPTYTVTGGSITNDQNANASNIGTRSGHLNATVATTITAITDTGGATIPAIAAVVIAPANADVMQVL